MHQDADIFEPECVDLSQVSPDQMVPESEEALGGCDGFEVIQRLSGSWALFGLHGGHCVNERGDKLDVFVFLDKWRG